MNRSRILWRTSSSRLSYFENKEVIFLHHPRVCETTLKVRIAFRNKRSFHFAALRRIELELLKFVGVLSRAVSDVDNFFRQMELGNVNNAFFAPAD